MLKQDYTFESRALYPELKGKCAIITRSEEHTSELQSPS